MTIYRDNELRALIWFYWLCPENKQARQLIYEAAAELHKREQERANHEKTTNQN